MPSNAYLKLTCVHVYQFAAEKCTVSEGNFKLKYEARGKKTCFCGRHREETGVPVKTKLGVIVQV